MFLVAVLMPMGTLTAFAAATVSGEATETATEGESTSNRTDTVIIDDAKTPLLNLDSGQASSSDLAWWVITVVFVGVAVLSWWFLIWKHHKKDEEGEPFQRNTGHE
jgi:hypothetical protein